MTKIYTLELHMEDIAWKSILERLISATNSKNESGLAAYLGISTQSIYNAKKKGQIPPMWVFEVAKTFGVSSDWLFFGRTPEQPTKNEKINEPTPVTVPTDICPNCAQLKIELEEERQERRELNRELRAISAENRELWKENARLREENATLRERREWTTRGGSSTDAGAIAG